jgi:hypothetical protein
VDSFASTVRLIHTGLQPGGEAPALSRNRFNGFRGKQGNSVSLLDGVSTTCGSGWVHTYLGSYANLMLKDPPATARWY